MESEEYRLLARLPSPGRPEQSVFLTQQKFGAKQNPPFEQCTIEWSIHKDVWHRVIQTVQISGWKSCLIIGCDSLVSTAERTRCKFLHYWLKHLFVLLFFVITGQYAFRHFFRALPDACRPYSLHSWFSPVSLAHLLWLWIIQKHFQSDSLMPD